MIKSMTVQCSNCGGQFQTTGTNGVCPNCGAEVSVEKETYTYPHKEVSKEGRQVLKG